MSAKPVTVVTAGQPIKPQNFYFQIFIQKLIAKVPLLDPTPELKFSICKGKQKFQSTKNLPATFQQDGSIIFTNIRLNFMVLNYNSTKEEQFALRIIKVSGEQEKQIGEYYIDCNNYIDHYVQVQNGAFSLSVSFSQQLALDAELYVERSRFGIEKLIKEIKFPKIKAGEEQNTIKLQKIPESSKTKAVRDESRSRSRERSSSRFKRATSPKKELVGSNSGRRLEFLKKREDSPPAKSTQVVQESKEPVKLQEKKTQSISQVKIQVKQVKQQLPIQSKKEEVQIKKEEIQIKKEEVQSKKVEVPIKNEETVINKQATEINKEATQIKKEIDIVTPKQEAVPIKNQEKKIQNIQEKKNENIQDKKIQTIEYKKQQKAVDWKMVQSQQKINQSLPVVQQKKQVKTQEKVIQKVQQIKEEKKQQLKAQQKQAAQIVEQHPKQEIAQQTGNEGNQSDPNSANPIENAVKQEQVPAVPWKLPTFQIPSIPLPAFLQNNPIGIKYLIPIIALILLGLFYTIFAGSSQASISSPQVQITNSTQKLPKSGKDSKKSKAQKPVEPEKPKTDSKANVKKGKTNKK